jgi:hypothetical protein
MRLGPLTAEALSAPIAVAPRRRSWLRTVVLTWALAALALTAVSAPAASAAKPEIAAVWYDKHRGDGYLEVWVADAKQIKSRFVGKRVRTKVPFETPPGQYLKIPIYRFYFDGKPPTPAGCFRFRATARNKRGHDRVSQRICRPKVYWFV